MPAVGLTPSGAVVAEDIRDLQGRSNHWPAALRRRRLPRRLLGVAFRTPAARRFEAIERALDLGDHSGRHARVAGRRLKLVVPEQCLDQPDIRAALQQMGRKAVAKRMQRQRLA